MRCIYKKIFNIFIIGLLLISSIPMPASAATTVAERLWIKDLGYGVNSVDTTEDGSKVYAGLSNGSIVAYDLSGTLLWHYHTNGSIKKLKSNGDGDIAWINAANETGRIDADGNVTAFKNNTYYNLTDVSITNNGQYFVVSVMRPGSFYVYNESGVLYASNRSYLAKNYTALGYDPSNQWLVVVNETYHKLLKWGIIENNGWESLNSKHDIYYPFDYGTRRDVLITNPNKSIVTLTFTSCQTATENISTIVVPASITSSFDILVSGFGNTTNYTSELGHNVITRGFYTVNTNSTFGFVQVGFGAGKYFTGGVPNWTNITGNMTPAGTGIHSSTSVSEYLNGPIKLESGRLIAVHNDTKIVYYSDNNGLNWSTLVGATNPWSSIASNYFDYLSGFYLINSSFPNGIRYFYMFTGYTSWSGVGNVYYTDDPTGANWVYLGTTSPGTRWQFWSAHNHPTKNKMCWWGGMIAPSGTTQNDMSCTVDGYTFQSVGSMPTARAGYGSGGFREDWWNGYYLRTATYSPNEGFVLASQTGAGGSWQNWSALYSPYWSNYHCSGIYNGTFYQTGIYEYSTYFTTFDGTTTVSSRNIPPGYEQYGEQARCVLNVTPSAGYPGDSLYSETNVYIGKNTGDLNVTLWYNRTGNNITSSTYNTSMNDAGLRLNGTMGDKQYQTVVGYTNVTEEATTGTSGTYIQAIDVPELGGWVGVSTSEPKVYHQLTNKNGFGSQYSGSANTGIAADIATADSAAYSIEGRSLIADIYQLDGTRKGTYTSGGTINSVDFAQKNGLWAVAGGDDGKFYIFSKDSTSSWYVFYQGDSEQPITATAISWRGEYAVLGRSTGSLEFYTTSAASSTSTFNINVFVNKGGSPYTNTTLTITQGATASTAINAYTSGETDSTGKFVFTGTDGKYYKVNVNSGEYEYIYQASSTYPTITINIPAPLVSRPYNYATSFNETTGVITTTYDDVNTATVNITITNINTNQVVHLANYTGTSVTDTYTATNNSQYRINLNFTRTTGHTYSDTLYAKSNLYNKVTHTPAQWVLFEYAVYSVFLMLVALGIGTTSLKYGVVILPALTVLGIMLGFLPLSIYTAGLFVSAFIAMLEVMRRRSE